MELRKIDSEINDLMMKFDLDEASKDESQFLINLTNDLVQVMHDHGIELDIDKFKNF